MSEAEVFFDTNILLYLLSADTSKADQAESLIAAGGVISVQVLNEFASVASRKLGMSWAEIRQILQTLRTILRVEPISLDAHERGVNLSERYGYSIYDSVILASALLAGCTVLFTEDLQDGHRIDGGLTIKNPFISN